MSVQHQRPDEAAGQRPAAVRDEICLDETRSRVLPIAERTYRHAAPQPVQRGAPAPALTGRHGPRGRQAAVDRRGTHRQEPLAHRRVQGQVAVMLERRHQGRQQRLQPLAAHPVVRRLPQNDQPLGHGRVVDAPAPSPRPRRDGTSVEDADRVLAVVPGESHELVQDQPLLGCRALPIPVRHRGYQLLSCSRTDRRHRRLLR